MPSPSHGPVAVVGLNMGGPIDQDAVQPFLQNLFADPDLIQFPKPLRFLQGGLARFISRRSSPEVKENYEKIGGGSPILRFTEAQMEGVVARLRQVSIDAHPFVAMRYAPPRAQEVVPRLAALKPSAVVAVSLYPFFSPTTGGSSLVELAAELRQSALRDVPLISVDRFGMEPFHLDAQEGLIRKRLQELGEPTPLIFFSVHGLPRRYIERGDPYRDEVLACTEALSRRLRDLGPTTLAFQSKVGPLEWLKPYTDDHLRDLAAQGVRRVLMVPLGFVSDNVETLFEQDLLYGDLARDLGLEFHRLVALNDDPLFVQGLGDLVLDRLQARSAAGPSLAEHPHGG